MFLLGSTAPFLPYLLLMLTTLAAWWGDWSAGRTEPKVNVPTHSVEAVDGTPQFEASYILQNIPAKKEIRTEREPAAKAVPSYLQKLSRATCTLLHMEAPEASYPCNYTQNKQWRGPPAKDDFQR